MEIKDKYFKALPLTFHKSKQKAKHKEEAGKETAFIAVKDLESDKVFPQRFYKPISKTIALDEIE